MQRRVLHHYRYEICIPRSDDPIIRLTKGRRQRPDEQKFEPSQPITDQPTQANHDSPLTN